MYKHFSLSFLLLTLLLCFTHPTLSSLILSLPFSSSPLFSFPILSYPALSSHVLSYPLHSPLLHTVSKERAHLSGGVCHPRPPRGRHRHLLCIQGRVRGRSNLQRAWPVRHDMIWPAVMWCDLPWCDMIWPAVMWCDVMCFDVMYCAISSYTTLCSYLPSSINPSLPVAYHLPLLCSPPSLPSPSPLPSLFYDTILDLSPWSTQCWTSTEGSSRAGM